MALFQVGAPDRAVTVAAVAGPFGLVLAILMALNYGYAPRVRGSVLEVSTLLGRQTVDLAALVQVGYHPQRYGRVRVRLRDPVNSVVIEPRARRPGGYDAVARAVWDAAGRGVSVPSEVSEALGLAPMPGQAGGPSGIARQLVIVALVLAGAVVCVGIGLLAALLMN